MYLYSQVFLCNFLIKKEASAGGDADLFKRAGGVPSLGGLISLDFLDICLSRL